LIRSIGRDPQLLGSAADEILQPINRRLTDMGGLTSTAVLSVLQSGIGLVQARNQARAQNAAADAAAQSQVQLIQRSQEIGERERRERLRRVLASQRAQFGAQGIGGGGSADAVLQGFTKDTDRAIDDDRSLDALRIGSIDRALAERRRRNLLEASRAQTRVVFGQLGRTLGGLSLLEP